MNAICPETNNQRGVRLEVGIKVNTNMCVHGPAAPRASEPEMAGALLFKITFRIYYPQLQLRHSFNDRQPPNLQHATTSTFYSAQLAPTSLSVPVYSHYTKIIMVHNFNIKFLIFFLVFGLLFDKIKKNNLKI